MNKPYYLEYLTDYGTDAQQFKDALKQADVETLQKATQHWHCTQTKLKRINAELRRREKKANS